MRRALTILLAVAPLLPAACGAEEPGPAGRNPANVVESPAAGSPSTPPSQPAATPPSQPAAPAEPWFVDEAAARGIDLLNQSGRPRKKELITGAVGPGAAVFDANADGWLDIYIPNGNWLTGPFRDKFFEGEDRPRNALYIQQPGGTFKDEAEARGVRDDAWGFGSCAADLDNDGDPDLVVTNLGPNRLYINDGRGYFTEIAAQAGIRGPTERGKWDWSTGISCGDYDRDGRLDLYISNYADVFEWMKTEPKIVRNPDGSIVRANVCKWQRLDVYCGPRGLPGQQDYLYRNVGGTGGALRFEDVTKASRIWRPKEEGGPLYGFQVLFTDLNRDGWPDIYVANDSVPSFHFESLKDGTFRECASEYGISVGMDGEDLAGMGAESADLNGDGWMDVLKTNFSLQTNNVYVADPFEGRVTFRDYSTRTGVQEKVFTDLGWAVLVFDYDHDGDRDLFFANGHVYPEVDRQEARALHTSFEQFNKLLRNESRGDRLRFRDVTKEAGPGFEIKHCSRGASLLDFDEDGDLDILVINLNSTPNLLVNRRGSRSGHWLKLKLVGNVEKKTTLEAIGTRILVRAGDHTQLYETKRGQGFLGCHDPRVHVGLGKHAGPVTLEVTWPNGDEAEFTVDQVDQVVEIRQE
ncbi:MAG: CRTAC1 family protein [Planctomycetota bacterium]